jgi:transcriptional regulator with XRE-family HTH domain
MATGIEMAIAAAGSQAELGKALGVTQQTVSLWLRAGYVPNEHIVPIEVMFAVPRNKLINPRLAALVDLPTGSEGTDL